jgi:hypothetical protein
MTVTLRMTRQAVGIELRRGTFDVLVDGNSVGSIDRNDTIEVPVEPGRHTVRVRAGRYSSQVRSFEAVDGDTVMFRVHGAMLWPRWLVSIFKPDLAISLKQ